MALSKENNMTNNEILYIYLISQNTNIGYDTYDGAIVVANSFNEARSIHPGGYEDWINEEWHVKSWTTPENVQVQKVGLLKELTNLLDKDPQRKEATQYKAGDVILSSFNAG